VFASIIASGLHAHTSLFDKVLSEACGRVGHEELSGLSIFAKIAYRHLLSVSGEVSLLFMLTDLLSQQGAHKQGRCDMALEAELETFERRLPELLANEGKFALVRGEEISIWPDADSAIDAGYERYGLDQFLVKKIAEHEVPRYFSRRVTRCQ
jgi:hypothetical protein